VIAVGIDVGKRTHEACFMDATGRQLGRSLRFANTAAGARLLEARLQALSEPATIALEASGHFWLGLHRWLTERGRQVEVINPLQTVALRSTAYAKRRPIARCIRPRGPCPHW
jgi:transposase